MKKHSVLAMALGLVLAFGAVALASDTATVSVSATVVGTCKFKTGGTVVFTLDPSEGGNAAGTVIQPTFWCTKGASYTITDDKGLNESGTTFRMKHQTLNEYISYTFTYMASGTGNGKSNPISMNITSSVQESDYINASAGSYSDTVTLTINP